MNGTGSFLLSVNIYRPSREVWQLLECQLSSSQPPLSVYIISGLAFDLMESSVIGVVISSQSVSQSIISQSIRVSQHDN